MTRAATVEEGRTIFPEWPDDFIELAIQYNHLRVFEDGTVYVQDVGGLGWTMTLYSAAYGKHTLDDDVDIEPDTTNDKETNEQDL
jgi:hypothetical protein